MNATLEFDASAYETLALFAQATSIGMFPGDSLCPIAIVDSSESNKLVLRLNGVNQESLVALRGMLAFVRSPQPAALRELTAAEANLTLEEHLQSSIRDLVSLAGMSELSGDALFMSVRGESSARLYDVVYPVVNIWQQMLSKQAFPYRIDKDSPEPLSTEGIEIYENSDVAVEVATTCYGGDEEGIAALVNGIARQLEHAGLSFSIECWSG